MTKLRGIKAVVFDLGGVLINLHADEARRELLEKYGVLADGFARLTRSSFEADPRSITELAMTGKVGTAEYLEAFLGECTLKDRDGLKANRLSVVGRERPDVFALVEQLRKTGFVCCVLSNTIALHWEKLTSTEEYPLLKMFDHVFASHLIKCAKPEQASYSFVANALKTQMSECLLVDDTPLNVDKAKAAGWSGFLFTNITDLQQHFSEIMR
jgi:epoxide hydrolase-like predicted phosphatase